MHSTELDSLSGGAHRIRFADVRHHPRFAEARKAYVDGFLEVYTGDPFKVRLLIEAGRFVVYYIVTLLEAVQDPARRETWATVGLLKKYVQAEGLASPRQIDLIVSRLCEVGFMELIPAEQDRRVRILKTTEKLHAHDRDWLAAHYAPLVVLFPDHDYGLVMRGDREFQALHRRTAMQFTELGRHALHLSPEIMMFFGHAGGVLVLAALMQAAMEAPDGPHSGVPYTQLADRFGVSRTHVRKMLESAQDAGLLKLHARGGHRVEILPRMWAGYDLGLAGGFYFHDVVYAATLERFGQPARTPEPAA